MSRHFKVSVPASSANIGPGFDVLGIGLNLFLDLDVTIDAQHAEESKKDPHNCALSYDPKSEGADSVPLKTDENLITRTALYVLRCNNIQQFPVGTKINVFNPIPLGRGLGSSGAAIVAGAILANEIGDLKLSKDRLLDYCLMIERHPDNITAAMIGGFVGSYLRDLNEEDSKSKDVPLSDVLPKPNQGHNTGIPAPAPPHDISRNIKYDWCKEVKCITIIPNFEVPTDKARSVLPGSYSTEDMIFNLQRLSILTTALTRSPPDPELIYPAMQDKVHQPYRKVLIPGLTEILTSVTPQSHPGLLGICLSGAGPTILALATENFENIATEIINRFKQEGIVCSWKLLEPAYEGAITTNY